MLSKYEGLGGLKEELKAIAAAGLAAEAANLGQSIAAGEGVGATQSALLMFEVVRGEYVQLMNVA